LTIRLPDSAALASVQSSTVDVVILNFDNLVASMRRFDNFVAPIASARRRQSAIFLVYKNFANNELHLSNQVWHRVCLTAERSPVRQAHVEAQ